jgi:Ca2+-binding EF-hand superfamily protein
MPLASLLLAAVLAATPAPSELSPEDVIAAIDRDGDAMIDWEEARNYANRRFHALDANGDGVLDATEFPASTDRLEGNGSLDSQAYQDAALNRFEAVDADGNGRISAEEIRAFRSRNPR